MNETNFNIEKKSNLEIVTSMLELLKPWRDLISDANNSCLFTTNELKNSVALVEKMVKNANLDEIESNILNDTLINKECNMDKLGRKYSYSNTGLKNKINLILTKIIHANF